MNADTILLIVAALCFVAQAFSITLGTFAPKWWALGVAFWLVAQSALLK